MTTSAHTGKRNTGGQGHSRLPFRAQCPITVKLTTQTTGRKRHLGTTGFDCLAVTKSLPTATNISCLRGLTMQVATSLSSN